MKLFLSSLLMLLALWTTCCASTDNNVDPNLEMEEEEMLKTTDGVAQVTEVSITGQDGEYTFNVTISSPDLGCQQYADWWEVIDTDGNLFYRRTLGHSHVNEQPFTRSGGPILISETIQVYVRAHMNTTSYGSKVFKGSVTDGFTSSNLDTDFAKDLEELTPLPGNCAF